MLMRTKGPDQHKNTHNVGFTVGRPAYLPKVSLIDESGVQNATVEAWGALLRSKGRTPTRVFFSNEPRYFTMQNSEALLRD